MRLSPLALAMALGAALVPESGAEAPGPPRPSARPTRDLKARRAQDAPEAVAPAGTSAPGLPSPIPPALALPPLAAVPATPATDTIPGSQPLSLQTALYGAIVGNPDLVALRQSAPASAEAVEVARRFPVTLNPTLFIDVRFLNRAAFSGGQHVYNQYSYRQPIELGNQTRYRHAIACAAFDQTKWSVVQAELLALVQTYRFFQTAAYRREKLRVARQLADFNDQLVATLRRRQEANQAQPADVALAEVEAQAIRQQVEVARQDYVNALTDLRNQIGTPEAAGAAEPLGEFVLPAAIPTVEDAGLIQTALQSRPEIQAAAAQVRGARAAVGLAKGDRIPTPVAGPQYLQDQEGNQLVGFVLITSLPVLNDGKPLVRQREAELRRAIVAHQQVQQRVVAQVRSAVAKWNQSNLLVSRTNGLTAVLEDQMGRLQRLFQENQADLTKLLQARQRLIQLENARLDAIWQATQAQADLLTALGAPALISALQHGPAAPANPAATAVPTR